MRRRRLRRDGVGAVCGHRIYTAGRKDPKSRRKIPSAFGCALLYADLFERQRRVYAAAERNAYGEQRR